MDNQVDTTPEEIDILYEEDELAIHRLGIVAYKARIAELKADIAATLDTLARQQATVTAYAEIQRCERNIAILYGLAANAERKIRYLRLNMTPPEMGLRFDPDTNRYGDLLEETAV